MRASVRALVRAVLTFAVPIACITAGPRERPRSAPSPGPAGEVYAAVILGVVARQSAPPMVVAVADSTTTFDRDHPGSISDPAEVWRLFELDRVATLPAEVAADYRQRNARRETLRGRATLRGPGGIYPLVSEVRFDTIAEARRGDLLIFTFSEIGFSSDGRLALVLRHLYCGERCGNGELVLLSRTAAGVWVELARAPLWIS